MGHLNLSHTEWGAQKVSTFFKGGGGGRSLEKFDPVLR